MRLILISGFLGAGKTTLVFELSKKLMQQGKRVGIITNDQSTDLVDTAFLLQTHASVSEVSGSCFCCNFHSLVDSIRKVGENIHADYIIAEPVGSCTDLVATTIKPLQDLLKEKLTIAPLSVLVDPFRLADILDGRAGGLHPSAQYIFQKQLEESDIILTSKVDLLEENQLEFLQEKVRMRFPSSEVMGISSYTGFGIEDWFTQILSRNNSGKKVLDLNYDIYAEGEALLGWLNASLKLEGSSINWKSFSQRFLERVSERIRNLKANVGHVKIFLESEPHYLLGNISGLEKRITLRGESFVSNQANLIVNARVEMAPESLDALIKEALQEATQTQIEYKIESWKSISPSYPQPVYRYA